MFDYCFDLTKIFVILLLFPNFKTAAPFFIIPTFLKISLHQQRIIMELSEVSTPRILFLSKTLLAYNAPHHTDIDGLVCPGELLGATGQNAGIPIRCADLGHHM